MNTKNSKRRPTAALIVAIVALVAAMSGAAVALPGKNTVKSNDIAKDAVKSSDIAKEAVSSAEITDDKVKSPRTSRTTASRARTSVKGRWTAAISPTTTCSATHRSR